MRRPEYHRTGELGEIHAIQAFTEAGWIVEKLQPDYGFDLLIQRTEKEVVFGDFALVQVKATRRPRRSKDGYAASVLVDRQHLELWQIVAMPCFLLLVTLPDLDSYILDCHALLGQLRVYGDGLKQKSYTVAIPEATRINVERMTALASSVQRFWTELRLRLESRPQVPTGATEGLVATTMLGALCSPLLLPGLGAAVIGTKIASIVGMTVSLKDLERNALVDQLRTGLSVAVGTEVAERVIREAIESSTPKIVAPNKGPSGRKP